MLRIALATALIALAASRSGGHGYEGGNYEGCCLRRATLVVENRTDVVVSVFFAVADDEAAAAEIAATSEGSSSWLEFSGQWVDYGGLVLPEMVPHGLEESWHLADRSAPRRSREAWARRARMRIYRDVVTIMGLDFGGPVTPAGPEISGSDISSPSTRVWMDAVVIRAAGRRRSRLVLEEIPQLREMDSQAPAPVHIR